MKNASIGLFRCQRIFFLVCFSIIDTSKLIKKKRDKKKKGENPSSVKRTWTFDPPRDALRLRLCKTQGSRFYIKKKKLCTPIGHEIEFEAFVKLTGNELCSIRRLILTCRSATTFHKSTMSPSFFASIADTASSVQVLQRSSCVMPDSETKSQS